MSIVQQQFANRPLYQIPTCSICLQDMNSDVVNLGCGHCFHSFCIAQQLEYQGMCPLCRKRSHAKQVRSVIFDLVENSGTHLHLKTLLASLDKSEKKQMEQLLMQIKKQHQKGAKLASQLKQSQNQTEHQVKTVRSLRQQVKKHSDQSSTLRRQNVKLKSLTQQLQQQAMNQLKVRANMQIKLDQYLKQEKNYQQFRRFKKMMYDSSTELVRYKQTLEKSQANAQERAQTFFDLLCMKNLEVLKMKSDRDQQPNRLAVRDQQISSLRKTTQTLKSQLKEMNQKRQAQKRQKDQLKTKYMALLQREKARKRGATQAELQQLEDSQNSRIRTPHIPQDPVVQTTLRRMKQVGGGVTFGGLVPKKKVQTQLTLNW